MDEWEIIKRHMQRPPVNVAAIIRELGIVYRELPMEARQSGYFRRLGGNQYEIGINAFESPQRQRFTAAHELGHYMFHRDLLREGLHYDRLFGDAAREPANQPAGPITRYHEIQANRFAADVIMPAESVARNFQFQPDVNELARGYGVSPSAMQIRLKNLGLIR